MAKKIIIFISPIILLVEIYLFSWIVDMLRQPSDVAVIVGVTLVCVGIIGNYFLIKFIQKQFKTTTK